MARKGRARRGTRGRLDLSHASMCGALSPPIKKQNLARHLTCDFAILSCLCGGGGGRGWLVAAEKVWRCRERGVVLLLSSPSSINAARGQCLVCVGAVSHVATDVKLVVGPVAAAS